MHALTVAKPPAARWTRGGNSTNPQLDGGKILWVAGAFSWARGGPRVFDADEPALAWDWLAAHTQIATQVDQIRGEGVQEAARHLISGPSLRHAAQIERDALRQDDGSRRPVEV